MESLLKAFSSQESLANKKNYLNGMCLQRRFRRAFSSDMSMEEVFIDIEVKQLQNLRFLIFKKCFCLQKSFRKLRLAFKVLHRQKSFLRSIIHRTLKIFTQRRAFKRPLSLKELLKAFCCGLKKAVKSPLLLGIAFKVLNRQKIFHLWNFKDK